MKTFCQSMLLLLGAFGALAAQEKPRDFNSLILEPYKARLLNSAMLAGDWLVNNQEKRTIYGTDFFNGDYGRWLYEYFPNDGTWRGSVGWTMATGIMDLIALDERTGEANYKDAIQRAALYIKSLQVLDPRTPRNFGAVREMHQLDQHTFPRDGVTTAWGYLALYRYTKDKDYLERAQMFGDWFLKYAWNPRTAWPYSDFPFDSTQFKPSEEYLGNFHGGSSLFFYHLYKATGDRRYVEKGLLAIADSFIKYFLLPSGAYQLVISADGKEARVPKVPTNHVSNDDFATIGLLAAFRESGNRRYWDAAMKHLDWLISVQLDNGAMPGYPAGAYVSAMTALETIDLAHEKGIKLDEQRLEKFIRRCSDYGLTMQETDATKDIKAYGGFYDQSWQGLRRDWIHARCTTYSVLFNLRYEGRIKVPFYSIYGWD